MTYRNTARAVQTTPREKTTEMSLGLPIVALAFLITSYFYVLPLGRYSVAGFLTDFRIYDITFVAFLAIAGFDNLPRLKRLSADRTSFFRSIVFFLWLLYMSLGLTFFLGGLDTLLPGIIRTYRFGAYFLAAGFVAALVQNPRQYRFLLVVFYINIVVQALLAFAQGTGLISPTFWPSYWIQQYGIWPVGTLSPHHLHVGIVMLLGIGLSVVFLRQVRLGAVRLLLVGIIGVMCAVIAMAGIRTAMVGVAGLVAADVFTSRLRRFPFWIILAVALFAAYNLSGEPIQKPVKEIMDRTVFSRLQRGGVREITRDRESVYTDFPEAIQKFPWMLLVGTGFQNSTAYIGSAGAHNNYLHVLFELGIIGFIVYMNLLFKILKNLRAVAYQSASFESAVALGMRNLFLAIMLTMFMGETLWAQYSQFTLTGQIMTLLALGISPLYWNTLDRSREISHLASAYSDQ